MLESFRSVMLIIKDTLTTITMLKRDATPLKKFHLTFESKYSWDINFDYASSSVTELKCKYIVSSLDIEQC